jgi:hypothetical protein
MMGGDQEEWGARKGHRGVEKMEYYRYTHEDNRRKPTKHCKTREEEKGE